MLPAKIEITPALLFEITNRRNELDKTAKEISLMCNKNHHWITNIENKKTKSMSLSAAKQLFSILYDTSPDDAAIRIEQILEEENHIEQMVNLQTDPNYNDYLADEYKAQVDDFNNHSKQLNEQLSKCSKTLHDMLNDIDFKNDKQLLSDETILQTIINLLLSQDGKRILSILFKYPLHKLNASTLKKICTILEQELEYEYTVDDNNPDLPYLKCDWKDEFNLFS